MRPPTLDNQLEEIFSDVFSDYSGSHMTLFIILCLHNFSNTGQWWDLVKDIEVCHFSEGLLIIIGPGVGKLGGGQKMTLIALVGPVSGDVSHASQQDAK